MLVLFLSLLVSFGESLHAQIFSQWKRAHSVEIIIAFLLYFGLQAPFSYMYLSSAMAFTVAIYYLILGWAGLFHWQPFLQHAVLCFLIGRALKLKEESDKRYLEMVDKVDRERKVYRNILQAMPEGVIILNKNDLAIKYVNHTMI